MRTPASILVAQIPAPKCTRSAGSAGVQSDRQTNGRIGIPNFARRRSGSNTSNQRSPVSFRREHNRNEGSQAAVADSGRYPSQPRSRVGEEQKKEEAARLI